MYTVSPTPTQEFVKLEKMFEHVALLDGRSPHQLSKAKHQSQHYSWGVIQGRAGDDIQMWSGTAAAT